MSNDISVGSVVFHKRDHIKGPGTVVAKTHEDGFDIYHVIWQGLGVPSGRFEHCRSMLLSLVEKSLAESTG
jgi:hypothetical protein